jgi:hypothetical protein
MTIDFDPGHVSALIAAGSLGGSVVLLAMRAWLERWFATLKQVATLQQRLQGVEAGAKGVADHAEVVEIERKVNTLEVSVGELRAELHADIRGVREGIGRVEHMVTLLVENGLRQEAANHAD